MVSSLFRLCSVGCKLAVSSRFRYGFVTVSEGCGWLFTVSSRFRFGLVTVSVGFGVAVINFVKVSLWFR